MPTSSIQNEIRYQYALLKSGWCSPFAQGRVLANARATQIRARIEQLRSQVHANPL